MSKIFYISPMILLLATQVSCNVDVNSSSGKPSDGQTHKEVETKFPADSPLISTAQLSELIKQDDSVRVIDVGQDGANYEKGHIPSASYVHWVTDITDPSNTERYNIIDKQQMEGLLSKLGISKQTHVIVYDDLSSRIATRMYWSLKYYGHEKVQVLDGGLSVWKKDFETSTETPNPKRTDYEISQVDDSIAANMEFIEKNLNNDKVKLIDGRPKKQFTGEEFGKVFHTGTAHKNKGHIPGAKNIFWKDNFREDGCFKSIEELRKMYSEHSLEVEDVVVTYCNEGLHAAPPWFVLSELLKFKSVKVYDDSMSEWANSDKPIETLTN